jgi:hypothetical protein
LLSAWDKGGGYYLGEPLPFPLLCFLFPVALFPELTYSPIADVGASQMLIDGKIKLKNDSAAIDSFVEDGIKFTDGSFLPADLVIFATG